MILGLACLYKIKDPNKQEERITQNFLGLRSFLKIEKYLKKRIFLSQKIFTAFFIFAPQKPLAIFSPANNFPFALFRS